MGVTRPPLEYLATCSKIALESFELSRLNEASNLRKEVQQILQGWIDTEVDARLARWILESKQAQARDGLQAAMAQPVPLKQLDLSFLPSNGAEESDGETGVAREAVEAEENTRKTNGAKIRRAAQAVLPCADERTPEEPQKSVGMKGTKLLEKRVGTGCLSGSAAAVSAWKPAFAQDEEAARRELEYFVQRELGTSRARLRNLAERKESKAPDGRSSLASPARRGRSDHFADVHVFPSTDALTAAAANCAENSRARLNVRTLICRPGLERSRSNALGPPRALCARRVAPAS